MAVETLAAEASEAAVFVEPYHGDAPPDFGTSAEMLAVDTAAASILRPHLCVLTSAPLPLHSLPPLSLYVQSSVHSYTRLLHHEWIHFSRVD
jgi:hypothetical protein